MTTVTCYETKHKPYIVPVGRCALHTPVYVPNFLDIHNNSLICLGESNKKEEPNKISDKKRLRIVPGAPTLLFSQGNQNSCIISSLASAFYYMRD